VDIITDNVEMQYRERQSRAASGLGFNRLLPINTDLYPEEEFNTLWESVSKADYAFEDSTRGDKVRFAAGMLEPGTYNFEIPGEIFAQLQNAYPRSNATIHFITLNVGPTAPMIDAASEMFAFAFTKVGVHRITAFIPSFNQKVIRMASLVKMRFEGQMRRTFQYYNEWWDLQIFGLLDSEWKRRG
jgi:hypothetical protein